MCPYATQKVIDFASRQLKVHENTYPTNDFELAVVGLSFNATMDCVSYDEEGKKDLVKDVHRLDCFGVRLEDSPNGGFTFHHNSKSSLLVEVKSK